MLINPVIRGFNPDPSVIAVGDDYYLATSTFEWYPGICIYHSKNLMNWEIVCHPVTALNFKGDGNSGGLWAPHLSYADGRFWLAVTDVRSRGAFKDTLNYITSCEKIDGIWSEPVFVNACGFDPALFHDDDGKKYFMNMIWDYRPGHSSFAGIAMQEYDIDNSQLIGVPKRIYTGTELGVAEGPQILKKDGWYYLLSAAGGTGYMHASAVARGKNIWGPYETSPFHPLITTADAPENHLQKSGHACFIQAGDEWYITHLCSRPLTQRGECVLGRETSLQAIVWENGWPRLANGGKYPDLEIAKPKIGKDVIQKTDNSRKYDFNTDILDLDFQSLRVPVDKFISLTERKSWLRMYGNESIISDHEQSLIARRWQSFCFRAETCMDFSPENFWQMAGLALFYNTENFFYAYKTIDFESGKQTLNLLVCEYGNACFEAEAVEIESGEIYLAANVKNEKAYFEYSYDGFKWKPLGGTLPANKLSDDYIEKKELVFTGSMVALCCQDLYRHTAFADFKFLNYFEL